MILEIGGKFPWVRKYVPKTEAPVVSVSVPAVAQPFHKSWVKLWDGRIGWLHHHEPKGWVIEVLGDTPVQTNAFTNIEAPING